MLLWDLTQSPVTGMIWLTILIGFVREFTDPTPRRVVNNVERNYLPLGSVGQFPGVLWEISTLSVSPVRDWVAPGSAQVCILFLIGSILIIWLIFHWLGVVILGAAVLLPRLCPGLTGRWFL